MDAAPPLLNLVVIRSADLERSERFYQVLGLKFERHRHGSGPEHLAAQPFEGGYVFEIYPASAKAGSSAGVRIGFRVDGVDRCVEQVIAGGGVIVQEPADSEWGRRAVVADPDGHRVELVESLERNAGTPGPADCAVVFPTWQVERLLAYAFNEIQLRSRDPKAVASLAYACHNLPMGHRTSYFDMGYFRGVFGNFHDEHGFMYDYLAMLEAIERGVPITFEAATGKWGNGLNGVPPLGETVRPKGAMSSWA